VSWADRRTGVGFDQLLLVRRTPEGAFSFDVHNADGSTAGQCGNGARCVARYLADRRHVRRDEAFELWCGGRAMTARVGEDHAVTVGMGRATGVDSTGDGGTADGRLGSVPAPAEFVRAGVAEDLVTVWLGNPHAVCWVPSNQSLDALPLDCLGATLQRHPAFPCGVNVEFVAAPVPSSPATVSARVYERGCGETQCCGSGATAVGVAWAVRTGTPSISVAMPGGTLRVTSSPAPTLDVALTGPAEYCYRGSVPTIHH